MSTSLKAKAIYGLENVRSLSFLAQTISLPFWEFLATGKFAKVNPEFVGNFKNLQNSLRQILKEDSQNIADGIYPLEVLKPESLKTFWLRYPKIILDGIKVARRKNNRSTHDFDQESAEYLRELPDYFQRNFHYQTGGYLTEKSAEIYEHQVEILFAGAADAMRRLLLKPLKAHFPYSQGEGLHFLEVAAGTGRLTRFLKLTFPKAKVTVLDISHPYLKKAQQRLREFDRLDFVQGDAADLSFGDEKFDAVLSCFLFHELPIAVRRRVLKEGQRVLRPGGFYGLVDSLQNEDRSNFGWALQQFPKDFHEPFYKNYLQNPMEGLLLHEGFKSVRTQTGFLAKLVCAEKARPDSHLS